MSSNVVILFIRRESFVSLLALRWVVLSGSTEVEVIILMIINNSKKIIQLMINATKLGFDLPFTWVVEGPVATSNVVEPVVRG